MASSPHKFLTLQVDERNKAVSGDCSCGNWSRRVEDVFARFQVHAITNDWLTHRGKSNDRGERD